MLNPSPDTGIDSLFESTHRVDVPVSTTVVPLLVTAPTLPPPSIPIMSQLKKILIEKLESNKSIQRSDEQRNLYKTLVDVYECDKIILDTYGHTFTLKRRHDDEDKDEEPSAGSDHGSKRRRAGKEPESTSAPKEKFYGFAINRESARDVYSKHRIIAVTELQIVVWYNYKHLDWINVRRVDDKLYNFKEGDLKRLHIQDIKDMLLLLVQGKLTNLTVEERFAFNNKDKQNRLMRIDELHKFSDGTLNDVRTALDDRIKRIRMKYLPQTIWIRSDKERATSMI
nr:hypothetical protein [Tanacetum cinerariifolium]